VWFSISRRFAIGFCKVCPEGIDRRERAHGGGQHHGDAIPAACSLLFLSASLYRQPPIGMCWQLDWISVLKISDKLIVLSSIIIFAELAGHFLLCFVSDHAYKFAIKKNSQEFSVRSKEVVVSKDLATSIQSTQFLSSLQASL
jgi:hypothetical protein